MRLTLIGAGYVGLVSGACFASLGHTVTCVDTDTSRINSLREGQCPIYEPGLKELLQEGLRRERLFFTSNLKAALQDAEVVFIAVGTPSARRGDGYADMSYVYDAARSIAPYLPSQTVVATKSTVPVGSARQIARILQETNPAVSFEIASNPEFLREGAAIHDFMHPDRVVLGADSERALEVLQQVYRPLYLIETPFVLTTPETAELIKYASNAFLATKISFINEMANLCEVVGADIQSLAKGMGLDKRIGPKFLHAGPGFGGSCLPKDTLALIRFAQEQGAPTRITEMAVEVNRAQRSYMIRKIEKALGGKIAGKKLAVLGLTFKPETDDMREAPSLSILSPLLGRGLQIRAHDPAGMEAARALLPDLEYAKDPYAACENADAVCLMTEWNLYRALDLKRIRSLLKEPVFIDLRNVYPPSVLRDAGFSSWSIGRPPSHVS